MGHEMVRRKRTEIECSCGAVFISVGGPLGRLFAGPLLRSLFKAHIRVTKGMDE